MSRKGRTSNGSGYFAPGVVNAAKFGNIAKSGHHPRHRSIRFQIHHVPQMATVSFFLSLASLLRSARRTSAAFDAQSRHVLPVFTWYSPAGLIVSHTLQQILAGVGAAGGLTAAGRAAFSATATQSVGCTTGAGAGSTASPARYAFHARTRSK
jgi:hypothetical protein